MPREISLNDPLSGAEIKQICVQKFADSLDRDSTLTDDFTYPGFTLKFEATIGFLRSTTTSTMVWGNSVNGKNPGTDAQQVPVNVEYKTDSPNTAREENDLPLPVMVQTPSGPKRQKVKFQRVQAKK